MPIGATYEEERVVVSGGKFERCLFKKCELVFDGKPTHMIDCRTEDCSWTFEGPAGSTLQMLARLCKAYPEVAVQLGRQLGIINEKVH